MFGLRRAGVVSRIMLTTVSQHLADIDRRGVLPRQLGIESRGVGDVADQAVEAAHVVLDDRPSSRALASSVLASGRVSTALGAR